MKINFVGKKKIVNQPNQIDKHIQKDDKHIQKDDKQNQKDKQTQITNKNNVDDTSTDFLINYNQIKDKTIQFIYQYKYKDDKFVTGIGDFIRGLYFMLQFSEKYNVNVEFNINKHYIKNYLEYFFNKCEIDDKIANNIPFIEINNGTYNKTNNIINYKYSNIDKDFLSNISNLPIYDKDIYLYSTNHPNEQKITKNHKQRIQDILKPTLYLSNLIDNAINNLKLVKNEFITIHIRTNDDCFSNKGSIYNKQLQYLINFIKIIYLKYKLDILILTSDSKLKNIIIKYVPYVKCMFNEICHTCDNKVDHIQIENTLKEFYMMSYSQKIYSFSVYQHGSGFSKWCAITYNIPYVSFFLDN